MQIANTFTLLCFLITSSVPAHSRCNKLLRKLITPKSYHDYGLEYRRGTYPDNVYALLKMILLKSHKLGLGRNEVFLISQYAKTLYFESHLVGAWVWSMGPFVLRSLPTAVAGLQVKSLIKVLKKILTDPNALAILEIENDNFLAQIEKYLNKKLIIFDHIQSFLTHMMTPALFAVFNDVSYTFVGIPLLNPLQLLASLLNVRFEDKDFQNEIENHIPPINELQVAVIYHQDLMKTFESKATPDDIHLLQNIKRDAAQFSMQSFHHFESFQAALEGAKEADLIYIISHGHPGNFILEQENHDVQGIKSQVDNLHQLSSDKKRYIVYLSCLMGNKYKTTSEINETWIRLTEKIQPDNAVSFSSTNIVSFSYETKNSESPSIEWLIDRGLTFNSARKSVLQIQLSLDTFYNTAQKGYRIYDSSSNTHEYIKATD